MTTRPFLLGTTLGIALGLLISWYRSLVRHFSEGPAVVTLREWEAYQPQRDPRLDELAERIQPAGLQGRVH